MKLYKLLSQQELSVVSKGAGTETLQFGPLLLLLVSWHRTSKVLFKPWALRKGSGVPAGSGEQGLAHLVPAEAALPSGWELLNVSEVNSMVSLGGALQSEASTDLLLPALTCSVM